MRRSNSGTNSLPFGKILTNIIAERGLTLQQLGDLAGVRSSVVQNWIEGKNPHDLRAVSRLAQALGIGFKSLLLGQDEVNSAAAFLSEVFDEKKLVEGLYRVSITGLTPRAEKQNEEEVKT